jgi:hypothetical protein|tara:strand:- start:507 stop:740 length:234 start_codon:yes stop_codon:yes gene_type:complete
MVTKTDTSKNSKDSGHRVLCPLCQEYFLDAELDMHLEYDHIKAKLNFQGWNITENIILQILIDNFIRKLRKINISKL